TQDEEHQDKHDSEDTQDEEHQDKHDFEDTQDEGHHDKHDSEDTQDEEYQDKHAIDDAKNEENGGDQDSTSDKHGKVNSDFIEAINEVRRKNGLRPQCLSEKLNDAALQHSRWMGQNNELTHGGDGDFT
ncbi:unnamed protein product, partial [Rotaria sp. Silwood1]